TRRHVLAVIDRLGYRPSGIARGLATQRTNTLGLVVPDIANPFFADVARGAEDTAYAEGYNVFVYNTDESPQRELAALQAMEEQRVDGLVLCSSRLAGDVLRAALDRHPAAVLVNCRLENVQVGRVLLADEEGGRAATAHLVHAGHRAVGFLAGPLASFSSGQRAAGYRAALEDAGLRTNPAWVRPCSYQVASGRGAASELLAEHPEVTALFCYNDLVAVGTLQACAELGRRVPDDVAVVGFDDIPMAAVVTPALTTCRVPRYEVGQRAMQLLLGRTMGDSDADEEIVFEPELVIRASAP
ncbi:MAG TPA: LacI family DNA-binding transcriptional regulator, partial [Anaerolineae bacterium]|nr:LacI family DNA-binding transcriptional regulator [Anaerolineae bacterium]